MTFITQKEIARIARMSNIALTEQEITKMQSHVESVLLYAARVQDIAKDIDFFVLKTTNVEREDVVIEPNSELILAQAPEKEEGFFVVPAIIEMTE